MGLSAALGDLSVAAFVLSFLHHMCSHQWLVSVLKVRLTAFSMMVRTRPPSVTGRVAAGGLSMSGRLTHRVSADSPSWPLPQGHWREPLDHPQKHRFPWRHQPLHPRPCPPHRPTTASRQMTSLATAGSEGRAIRLSSGMRCSQGPQCRCIESGSA